MNLLGSLNYSNTNCSDIWGWEDGLGNEYALVGLKNGFSCVNVTNPISPIEEFSNTLQHIGSISLTHQCTGNILY